MEQLNFKGTLSRLYDVLELQSAGSNRGTLSGLYDVLELQSAGSNRFNDGEFCSNSSAKMVDISRGRSAIIHSILYAL
ncbi:unnamed protein product [Nippostrongylus brasiliensis]|uniref:Uncharacterized protein n=1 Tax=Nippostrongylus brasiliensis TaxID=27835 RepID=A0A0N4YZP4_NIPBR|nr:unnamed protein product [Nippostrongylus brasiliensis]